MTIITVDLSQFIFGKILSIKPMANMHMLMRKCDWWMSMMITGSLSVINLKITFNLWFINAEVEVRLRFHLFVNFRSDSITLLLLKLLFKTEGFKLLTDQSINSLLDIFYVLMIIFIYLWNFREDSLFLLRRTELRKPFSFRCLFILFFFQVNLRVLLEFFVWVSMECRLDVSVLLSCLGCLLSTQKCLKSCPTKASLHCGLDKATKEWCLWLTSLGKEHIF